MATAMAFFDELHQDAALHRSFKRFCEERIVLECLAFLDDVRAYRDAPSVAGAARILERYIVPSDDSAVNTWDEHQSRDTLNLPMTLVEKVKERTSRVAEGRTAPTPNAFADVEDEVRLVLLVEPVRDFLSLRATAERAQWMRVARLGALALVATVVMLVVAVSRG